MRKLLICLVSLCVLSVSAQVTPTPNPIPVGYTGEITIVFDATKGNGGMIGATKCYAHTGLITSASAGDSDWKNVIGKWREAGQPELTSLGNNKWQLVISNMYEFYGVPETTNIKKLAFVFHDGPGGSKEGKAVSGDIFVVLGEKTESDIWDAVDGVQPITGTRPSGISNGIYYGSDGTSVTLCTYAANRAGEPAKRVFLIGDMTDWKLNANYQMKRDGNYFWITVNGLTKGKEYAFQYAVERADGVRKQICDLYSEKVLHPDDQWEPQKADTTLKRYPTKGADGGFVTVIQPGKAAFSWSEATLNFKRPNKNNLLIYELWVGDYTSLGTYQALMKRLDYIQNLGVNAIELMPITEFDGNMSWGYNPALYFAPDKAYGKADDLKTFIDECHKRGIAVILDMVLNHTTGLNPMAKLYPWTSSSESATELRFNPWFNLASEVKHSDNNYGEDWNHDFAPAHEMFTRMFQYWLKEYKVDGFRLDLSHGLCGRNTYDAVTNLKDYYTNGVQAASPGAYLILEHWGSNMSSDRPQLISAGMLCWANTSNAYCQTAMGWLKEGDGFTEANADGYVSYAESHDEERMQYKAKKWGAYNIKEEAVRIDRVPENVAFNVLLNGSHMLWQFEELGYDFSINSSASKPSGTSSGDRCSKKPRPETYGYFTNASRVAAFTKCAQVVTLRTQLMPSVFEGNPTSTNIGSGAKKRHVQWGSDVYVVANFDTIANQSVTLPSGTWYDYLNGGTKASSSYSLAPGELKVFTGSPVQAPMFSDIEKRDSQGFEDLMMPDNNTQKILLNGQIYILRGDQVYDLMGRRVE